MIISSLWGHSGSDTDPWALHTLLGPDRCFWFKHFLCGTDLIFFWVQPPACALFFAAIVFHWKLLTWGLWLQLGPVYSGWHLWWPLVHQVPELQLKHFFCTKKCFGQFRKTTSFSFAPNASTICARQSKPLICKPARATRGRQRPPEPALPPRGAALPLPPPPDFFQGAAWTRGLGGGAILVLSWLHRASTCCLELWSKGSHTCGKWTSRVEHGLWLAWSSALGCSSRWTTLERTTCSYCKGYHSVQGQAVFQDSSLVWLQGAYVTVRKGDKLQIGCGVTHVRIVENQKTNLIIYNKYHM